MIKKIIAGILSAVMITSSVSALAAYTDVTGDKKNTAASVMAGLGIIEEESSEVFGETTVTRQQFASYAARLFYHDVDIQNNIVNTVFNDIDTQTKDGAAVEFLANAGVIVTDSESFYPDEPITYSEAVRIVVNGLGYGEMAKASGGFPGGYIKMATDLDLNKGLVTGTNDAMNKSDVALLFYNALFAETMHAVIGTEAKYEKSGETLMEEALDVYDVTGVVYGVEESYIGSNMTLGDGKASINGEVMNIGRSNVRDYLGYSVKVFYQEDIYGDKTIVAVTPKDTQTLTVNAKDLSVEGNLVKYEKNGTDKKVNLANVFSVVYNGSYTTSYTNLEEILNIDEGEVTFIANEGSSKYSIIIVRTYMDILVERIDKKNNRIYAQNSSVDAAPYLPMSIELDPDEVDYTITLDGRAIGFEEIVQNDVVTVYMSADGETAELVVSRDVISGKVNGMTLSEHEITINGEVYGMSAYFMTVGVGDSGNFAMTADGRYVGSISAMSTDLNYAYLMKLQQDDTNEIAYIKLYTVNNEFIKAPCAEKVKINGVKYGYASVKENLVEGELVTFKMNEDGYITQVNRPYDATTNPDYYNNTYFVKNWSKSSVRYVGGILGRSLVTRDTMIFYIPRFDRGVDSDYRIYKMTDLEDRIYSDVTCYDVNKNGEIGAIVITEDVTDTVDMDVNLFFVKKVIETCNEDDEKVYSVTGYEAGEEKTLIFTSETSSVTYEDGWMNYVGNEDFDTGYNADYPGSNLNVGDAIQYTLDYEGNVGAYRLVYNNHNTIYIDGELCYDDPKNFFEDWSASGAVTKVDFEDELYIAIGDVQLRYNNYMVILALNEQERAGYKNSKINMVDYYRPVNLLNASVYEYSVSRNRLELGTMDSISKSDIVFVRSLDMGDVNEVMVFVD